MWAIQRWIAPSLFLMSVVSFPVYAETSLAFHIDGEGDESDYGLTFNTVGSHETKKGSRSSYGIDYDFSLSVDTEDRFERFADPSNKHAGPTHVAITELALTRESKNSRCKAGYVREESMPDPEGIRSGHYGLVGQIDAREPLRAVEESLAVPGVYCARSVSDSTTFAGSVTGRTTPTVPSEEGDYWIANLPGFELAGLADEDTRDWNVQVSARYTSRHYDLFGYVRAGDTDSPVGFDLDGQTIRLLRTREETAGVIISGFLGETYVRGATAYHRRSDAFDSYVRGTLEAEWNWQAGDIGEVVLVVGATEVHVTKEGARSFAAADVARTLDGSVSAQVSLDLFDSGASASLTVSKSRHNDDFYVRPEVEVPTRFGVFALSYQHVEADDDDGRTTFNDLFVERGETKKFWSISFTHHF